MVNEVTPPPAPTIGPEVVPAQELVALLDQLDVLLFRVQPETLEVTLIAQQTHTLFSEAKREGRFWEQLAPEPYLTQLREAIGAVAEDGVQVSLEHPGGCPESEHAWYRTSLRRVRLPKNASQVLVAMQDITAARMGEQHWQEVETWLATLGETLPFELWILDRSGRVLLQNPASIQRVGPVIGRRLEGLALPREGEQSWYRCFQRALKGERVKVELLEPTADGVRHLSRVAAPIRGERDGQASGVLGLDLDITQLRDTERKLTDSLKELRQTQDELVHREQLAALGEMAAVVAHEVRNPLGAIFNALSMLRRDQATSPWRGEPLFGVIEEEVHRLDRLVSTLLDFVRPMTAELSPGPLLPLIEQALELALRADGHPQVEVRKALAPDLPPVMLDTRLLGLAIGNLLRNALQAMNGRGQLTVSVEREGGWARLLIEDTGPGIPQEIRHRLFEPFVTTRPTGTGLGLAIVRRVVDEHRGHIELDSAPGRGARCILRLPLAP